jgi:ribosomal protein S18 acetylase RimI-like enzyme
MSLPKGFSIRPATLADLDTLIMHRREMFRDIGYKGEPAFEDMAAKCRDWLRKYMDAGEYLAWLVIAPDGSVAAGAGLWLMDWMPHLLGKSQRRGNILNVYTANEYRRRGLARELMQVILGWCRANAIDTIVLHASADGRSLYESLGFKTTNEMRLKLE